MLRSFSDCGIHATRRASSSTCARERFAKSEVVADPENVVRLGREVDNKGKDRILVLRHQGIGYNRVHPLRAVSVDQLRLILVTVLGVIVP